MTSKYISNHELERFNLFYRPTSVPQPDFLMEQDFPRIEDIFADPDVFYVFVFIKHPKRQVGHWCLLIKHSDTSFEWFDCLGKAIPPGVWQRLQDYSNTVNDHVMVHSLKQPVMGLKNWICGKWCMFRVMTLPATFNEFNDKLVMIRDVMPLDEFVDFMVSFKI